MLVSISFFVTLFLSFGILLARCHPFGTLIVSKHAKRGHFLTIQEAVNALSLTDPAPQHIFIHKGYYPESVLIPARKASLKIKGQVADKDKDALTYSGNLVTIGRNASQADGLTNDETATLRVHMDKFSLHNVNVKNEFLRGGSQALALRAIGDRQSYLGSSFTSYIDVIGNERGNHFFANSYIEGGIDVLFGRTANAYFHNCDFAITSKKHGWLLASGRESDYSEGRYLISESRIQAKNESETKTGTVFLGRPWGTHALSGVQLSYLSDVINSTGWDVWQAGKDERTEHSRFYEYGNYGPDSVGQRAPFATSLTKPIGVKQVLNSTFWLDPKFITL